MKFLYLRRKIRNIVNVSFLFHPNQTESKGYSVFPFFCPKSFQPYSNKIKVIIICEGSRATSKHALSLAWPHCWLRLIENITSTVKQMVHKNPVLLRSISTMPASVLQTRVHPDSSNSSKQLLKNSHQLLLVSLSIQLIGSFLHKQTSI